MKRKDLNTHQECLRQFGDSFKKKVREDLKFWQSQDKDQAALRAVVFSSVLLALREAASSAGVPLQDIGIEDFDIPAID